MSTATEQAQAAPAPLALQGVRILDFTILMQGPHATMMLGDLGADVIKVERPARIGGPNGPRRADERYGPQGRYGQDPADSTWYASIFLAHNRNKRSITVDMKKPRGKELIRRLVESCDVVYENFRPGVMDQLGFGYEACRAINPRIIYVAASGFGPTGPYAQRPGQDVLAQGMSGMAALNAVDGRPSPITFPICDLLGAMYGVFGTLGALYHRAQTGRGQRVDVSLLNGALAALSESAMHWLNSGADLARGAATHANPFAPSPYGIYQTADGHLALVTGAKTLPSIAELLGIGALGQDPRFQSTADRVAHRAEIDRQLEQALRRKTTAEWVEIFGAVDAWVAPVNSLGQAFSDPQVLHNEMLMTMQTPAGPVRMPGFPYKLSETPAQVLRPPPKLGEHTDEVLAEIGYTAADIAALHGAEVL